MASSHFLLQYIYQTAVFILGEGRERQLRLCFLLNPVGGPKPGSVLYCAGNFQVLTFSRNQLLVSRVRIRFKVEHVALLSTSI